MKTFGIVLAIGIGLGLLHGFGLVVSVLGALSLIAFIAVVGGLAVAADHWGRRRDARKTADFIQKLTNDTHQQGS